MQQDCCSICAEICNRSNRKAVPCPYCEYNACRQCWETWFLQNNTCFCLNRSSCNKTWSRKQLRKEFTQTFVNKTLREHERNVIFDRERSLMPETQIYLERIVEGEKLFDSMNDIQNQIKFLQHTYREQMTLQRELLSGQIYDRNEEIAAKRSINGFVRTCSREDCMGFLSTQWKCGVCESFTCNHCHELKGETHVCDPNAVATAQLLSRDTKPCPKCHTGIYKISGCDQMWCTQCQTAFSWRTGIIENNIHNPHYYEWLRRTQGFVPRNPDEYNPCDDANRRRLHHAHLNSIRYRMQSYESSIPSLTENLNRLGEIVQHMIHHSNYLLQRYRVEDNTLDQRFLRIDFMRKKISQDNYKYQLEQTQRDRDKYQEFHDIYSTLIQSSYDICLRIYDNSATEASSAAHCLSEYMMQFDRLFEYINECLLEIAITFKCTRYSINAKGEIISESSKKSKA